MSVDEGASAGDLDPGFGINNNFSLLSARVSSGSDDEPEFASSHTITENSQEKDLAPLTRQESDQHRETLQAKLKKFKLENPVSTLPFLPT